MWILIKFGMQLLEKETKNGEMSEVLETRESSYISTLFPTFIFY